MLKEKAEAVQMWKTGYKKPKPKLDKKERDCMMCYNPFLSEGIHNRICTKCKETEYYQSGQDYSMVN